MNSRKSLTPPPPGAPNVTLLLADGNPESFRLVIDWAYSELHERAVHYIRKEPPGRTLQATALLHEGLLRLIQNPETFKNKRRGYVIRAGSQAMRRVLVDSARRRAAKKRGRDWRRVDFSEAERLGFEQPNELLDFDFALRRLEKVQPLWSEVAELRIFGQLSSADAAEVLGIAGCTARKYWTRAKAWLREDLKLAAGERGEAYAGQMANALAVVHSAGIVHRDLKPANFVIANDGIVKLLDFGLAKIIAKSSQITLDGAIVGTTGYMSPEQVLGQPADQRSDVFALGTVLYHMLTGRRPFARDSDVEEMHAVVHAKAPRLAATMPRILRTIVRRCLEKHPSRRYQSVAALRTDLAHAAQSAGIRRSGVRPRTGADSGE